MNIGVNDDFVTDRKRRERKQRQNLRRDSKKEKRCVAAF